MENVFPIPISSARIPPPVSLGSTKALKDVSIFYDLESVDEERTPCVCDSMTVAINGVSDSMYRCLPKTYHWTSFSSVGFQSLYSSGIGPFSRCIMKDSAVFWCLDLLAGGRDPPTPTL
jgi:hypothetical protein